MSYDLTPEDRHERELKQLRKGVKHHGQDLPGLGIDMHRIRRARDHLKEAVEETDRQAEWDEQRGEA